MNGQAFQSCHLQSWNPQLDLVADEAGFPRRSGFDWPSDIVAICHKLPQISSTFSGLPTFVNNRSIYFFWNLLYPLVTSWPLAWLTVWSKGSGPNAWRSCGGSDHQKLRIWLRAAHRFAFRRRKGLTTEGCTARRRTARTAFWKQVFNIFFSFFRSICAFSFAFPGRVSCSSGPRVSLHTCGMGSRVRPQRFSGFLFLQ